MASKSEPRPVFHPDLGRFFTELREGKGWKQRQAATIAANRRIPITRQVLLRLEKGKTKNPEPEVLQALATLYGMSYEQLVERFVARRFGLLLVAPTSNQNVKIDSGISDAAKALSVGVDTPREIEQDQAGEDADVVVVGQSGDIKTHTRRVAAVNHAASAHIANLIIKANRRLDAIRADLNAATAALGEQAATAHHPRPGIPSLAGSPHRRTPRRPAGGGRS